MLLYFLFFILAGLITVLITPRVLRLAVWSKCVDQPKPGSRKIHSQPTPLLGGWAIFLSVATASAIFVWTPGWNAQIIPFQFLCGLLGGGLVLMLGGFLDDRYNLPARCSVIFPALAAFLVVSSGIGVGINILTNPLGGDISLNGKFLGLGLSSIFTWCWLMGMTYTTKLLDGLDGLASGVALIGGAVIFALSLTAPINQPLTAMLAIIFCGAILGFLVYGFYPAKIFLGESGSTFLGFFLGCLAVLTGAKVATAALVMGIPILDAAWAIIRRLLHKKSPFSADREHLHFLLLDAGLSQKTVALSYYGLAAIFGFTAVFLQSYGKLLALLILLGLMVGLVGFAAKWASLDRKHQNELE